MKKENIIKIKRISDAYVEDYSKVYSDSNLEPIQITKMEHLLQKAINRFCKILYLRCLMRF